MTDEDELQPIESFTELREVTCGSLSVVVDFNELYRDAGPGTTFELIAKLKDLLA